MHLDHHELTCILSILAMAEKMIAMGDEDATRFFYSAVLENNRGILRVLPLGLNL